MPVDGGREYVAKVTGFVSAPRERRTTRDGQYFFVNKRFVRDKTIAGGLLEGFARCCRMAFIRSHYCFLDIPLEEIDVNVHPAKTEIRFRRGEAVKDVIAEAVRTTLARAGITGDDPLDLRLGRNATDTVPQPARVEPQAPAEQAPIDFRLEPETAPPVLPVQRPIPQEAFLSRRRGGHSGIARAARRGSRDASRGI